MSRAFTSCSSAMASHRMSTPNSPSSLQALCGMPSGPGAEFLLCLMALARSLFLTSHFPLPS
eukprot:491357-Heterocapsa_arctica.AAC.1